MRESVKGAVAYLKWLFGGYDAEIAAPSQPYMYDRCHQCGAIRPYHDLYPIMGPSDCIIGFYCNPEVGHATSDDEGGDGRLRGTEEE
jgi:hypothetical protein